MINSTDEFIRLTDSDDPALRQLAKTDEVSEAVLLDVLDKHPDYTSAVVRSNHVTLRILNMLSGSSDWRLRCNIASKRKLSESMFEQLSRDPHEAVRHTIACNKKAPKKILNILANDECVFVAEAAKENSLHLDK